MLLVPSTLCGCLTVVSLKSKPKKQKMKARSFVKTEDSTNKSTNKSSKDDGSPDQSEDSTNKLTNKSSKDDGSSDQSNVVCPIADDRKAGSRMASNKSKSKFKSTLCGQNNDATECAICLKVIVDRSDASEGEDSIFCEGYCQS